MTRLRQAQDEGFADAAGRLAGAAGLAFGWSPATFWAATPAELAALVHAARGDGHVTPPDGAMLARLKEQFPDG
ncbi:phage tail assembly chaperone [Sphingomonas sp. CJ20]